jgi:hypothetical protein
VASLQAAAGAAGSTTNVGSTFTLTTSVDAVSGGAADDIINGLFGSGNTFSVGDSIFGGGGSDTLTVNVTEQTAAPFVSIDSVETINLRLLGTTGAADVTVNARNWSGATVITNASSLAQTTLEVSGIAVGTKVQLEGNTRYSASWANSTTGTVSSVLVNAGSAGTATTFGSATAASSYATLDLDGDNAGLISAAAFEVRGSLNIATIEAGSNVLTYTITGTGNAALQTDDTITSFDASAAAGNIDITFDGASDVVAKGGAGNDTFRFGTTYSNADSVNGGAGTDSVLLTIGSFNRNLNTTNVESATVNFVDASGGDLNGSGSTVATYNLFAGSANADGSISNIANASTVNLTASADAFDAVTIDAASGAQTMTIVFGSGSGSTTVSALAVSDAAAVTINVASNTTGTNTIGSADFDSDTKSIAINTLGGDANLAMSGLDIGGATALTITTTGSAAFTLSSALVSNSALAALTLTANTTASDIKIADAVNGSGLSTVRLDANQGANVYAGTLEFGNGASAGASTYTVILSADTNSDVGTAASNETGVLIETTGVASISLNLDASSASATIHVGGFAAAVGGTATASATDYVLMVSAGSIGDNSIVRLESANFTTTFTGTQVNIGAITVGVSGTLALFSGGLAATAGANLRVSAGTITLGQSAIAEVALVSGIENSAGSIGSITLVAATGASATFGTMSASSIGSFSLSLQAGASATFGNIGADNGGTAGNIGSIEIDGADTAGVDFGTLKASGIGAIRASGALDVEFGAISTTTIGTIDASAIGASGAFTIDLSGVVNAAEVKLGAGTNSVTSGLGNDVITLRAGVTGNDTIRYTLTAAGSDDITGFFAGSTGQDVIAIAATLGTAGLWNADGSAVAAADAADLSVVINGSGASAALVATDNIIVLGTALANVAAMEAFLNTAITFSTANFEMSANFLVAWSDGNNNTYISVLGSTDAGSAGATTLTSASSTITSTTLATLNGVTPGQLVAANFDFI